MLGLLFAAQFRSRVQFWVLESPAQFSTHCIVIGSTVRLRILGLGIVIERTVCEKCCCYLQHSLPGQAAGFLQNLLLSSAQFACSVLFAAQFKSMCSIEQPLRPYIPYPTISTVPTVSTVPIVHTVLIVATVDTVGTVGVIRIDCI